MAKKTSVSKLSDDEQVANYMDELKHPLKKEIEALRKIIRGVDKRIGERIKWNAPSYYFQEDILTFGPLKSAKAEKIILVFHNTHIVNIKSALLQGDYKDRRLVYFQSMKEITAAKNDLVRIVKELISAIESGK